MQAFYVFGDGDYMEVRCANGSEDVFVSEANDPADGWKIAEKAARDCAHQRGTEAQYRDLPQEANARAKDSRAAWVAY